ncbi:hypothetical protein DPX16_22908 [Anabarilius grahami]|uniref:Uncharacterized protein n=1 Tax=Anabarilius grahami TaxID=495550 RepID=A0A3N0XM63_ANAGA|nr:hypothetical protein DPX16_22908 [Anabarilius grahami]
MQTRPDNVTVCECVLSSAGDERADEVQVTVISIPGMVCTVIGGYLQDMLLMGVACGGAWPLVKPLEWSMDCEFWPICFRSSPSGCLVGRPVLSDAALMSILSEAVAEMGMYWSVPEQPVKKWMDGCYLHAGRHPDTPAPFFSELYEELRRSWCSRHTARAHVQGSHMLSVVEGADKLGYVRLSSIKKAIAAHLCPSCGLKALLPSKPCQTTAHIAKKAYASWWDTQQAVLQAF